MPARTSALLFALCLGAAPAFAQDNIAVADWNTFCFSTQANIEIAIQRAEEAGLTTTDTGLSRALVNGREQRTLQVDLSDGRKGKSGACMVSHKPGQGNLAAAVEKLLGHPPAYREGDFDVWLFDDTGDELVWISNDDVTRARDAAANRRMVFMRAGVVTGEDQTGVQTDLDIVMYEFLRK